MMVPQGFGLASHGSPALHGPVKMCGGCGDDAWPAAARRARWEVPFPIGVNVKSWQGAIRPGVQPSAGFLGWFCAHSH